MALVDVVIVGARPVRGLSGGALYSTLEGLNVLVLELATRREEDRPAQLRIENYLPASQTSQGGACRPRLQPGAKVQG